MTWFLQTILKGTTRLVLVCVSVCGCASQGHNRFDDVARTSQLSLEIARLNQRVAVLSQRLEQQNARTVVKVPVNTCRVVESQQAAPSVVNVESDLRAAQRALVQVIERLALSPDAKRELLQSLRPARSLDTENPWVAAN